MVWNGDSSYLLILNPEWLVYVHKTIWSGYLLFRTVEDLHVTAFDYPGNGGVCVTVFFYLTHDLLIYINTYDWINCHRGSAAEDWKCGDHTLIGSSAVLLDSSIWFIHTHSTTVSKECRRIYTSYREEWQWKSTWLDFKSKWEELIWLAISCNHASYYRHRSPVLFETLPSAPMVTKTHEHIYGPLQKYWNSSANPIVLLYTEDIWVWDQNKNI